jgi:hypothetical protein
MCGAAAADIFAPTHQQFGGQAIVSDWPIPGWSDPIVSHWPTPGWSDPPLVGRLVATGLCAGAPTHHVAGGAAVAAGREARMIALQRPNGVDDNSPARSGTGGADPVPAPIVRLVRRAKKRTHAERRGEIAAILSGRAMPHTTAPAAAAAAAAADDSLGAAVAADEQCSDESTQMADERAAKRRRTVSAVDDSCLSPKSLLERDVLDPQRERARQDMKNGSDALAAAVSRVSSGAVIAEVMSVQEEMGRRKMRPTAHGFSKEEAHKMLQAALEEQKQRLCEEFASTLNDALRGNQPLCAPFVS